MEICDIAIHSGFDENLLESLLLQIKEKYEKRLEGYTSYLNQTEVNALINDTKNRAKNLADCLKSLPIDVKEEFNSRCLPQIIANQTDNGEDTDLRVGPKGNPKRVGENLGP